jgi:hypothetical protein
MTNLRLLIAMFMLTTLIKPVVRSVQAQERSRENFNRERRFALGDVKGGEAATTASSSTASTAT